MHSIPFRLFVVNELDLQDADRSKQRFGHPLGVLDESEYQPMWKSKPDTPFPQELGLILLSDQLATIKSLRLTVELARAPSQIAIFTAIPPQQECVHGRHSLDAVSRYLSAEWIPCGKPVLWEACLSTTLDADEESDSRVVPLHIAECAFIKLVLHAPRECPRNQSHQVVMGDIELFGSFGDQCLSRTTSHGFGRIYRPLSLSAGDDNDELQEVLLDAGVPMDLVAHLLNTYESKLSIEVAKKSIETVPESNLQDKESAIVPDSTTASEPRETNANEDREPPSPFDSVLRQYVEQTARERAVLEDILDAKFSDLKHDISLWQSPTISPTDPTNSNEIALYTFGAFFTQCLLCGGSDIQLICVQLAERSARLLRQVIGATAAFEGIVALIVLVIRETKSSQVFQAAIHLARTVFLTEVANTNNTPLQPQLLTPHFGASSTNTLSVGLLDDIARPNWSYGLRIILEWSLTSPFCWSVARHGGGITSSSLRSAKSSFQFATVPPSIDRGFLQFIRLLIKQDLTRASFFDELLDLEPMDSATGSILATNRLRLIRLVLRNEIIRCQVATNVSASIHVLCNNIMDPTSTPTRSTNNDLSRLASECLDEINRHQTSYTKSRLIAVNKHLETSNNSKCHHSHCHHHTALYIQDPFTDADATTFVTLLRRYFSFQPRPNALYRHSFVRANKNTEDKGGEKFLESLSKGNISFQGRVVARTPPKGTFHDKIQQNSAPFVFDIGTAISKKSQSSHPVRIKQIVSSFATFRGIVEQRSDPSTRTSKVSPDDKTQDALAAPAKTALTTNTSTTMKNVEPTTVAVNTSSTVKDVEPTTVAVSSVNKTTIIDADVATSPIQDTHSATGSDVTKQMLSVPSPLSERPGEVPAGAQQEKLKPDDMKQVKNAKSPDRPKKQSKDKSKEKPNSNERRSAKDPDNCILQ